MQGRETASCGRKRTPACFDRWGNLAMCRNIWHKCILPSNHHSSVGPFSGQSSWFPPAESPVPPFRPVPSEAHRKEVFALPLSWVVSIRVPGVIAWFAGCIPSLLLGAWASRGSKSTKLPPRRVLRVGSPPSTHSHAFPSKSWTCLADGAITQQRRGKVRVRRRAR